FLAVGLIDEARREAERCVAALAPFLERATPLVGLEPSCMLGFRDEIPSLVKREDARRLAANALLFEEFLAREAKAGALKLALAPVTKRALLDGHCHQKAFAAMGAVEAALRLVPDLTVETVDSSCCGMAGAFRYGADTFDVSLKMAELSLLPAVRKAPADTLILADGTPCRPQIQDGTGRAALPVAPLLAMSGEGRQRAAPDVAAPRANPDIKETRARTARAISDQVREDSHAGKRDEGAAELVGGAAMGDTADGEAERNSRGVEERGRQQEARCIGAAASVERHLGAVGVAVEDREHSDEPHRDGNRGLAGECHDGAEHDHRGGDTESAERRRDAGQAERAAGRYDEDEGRGHEPERAAAELPGEDADGDHRQNVVEPAERMRETGNETVRITDAGM